jgi:transposase-like protein
MNECPYCHATDRQVRAGKNDSGSQRLKCQHCQHRYTPESKEHGYPEAVHHQAVQYAVDGLNYRRIARPLGVDHKSVINWVQAYTDQLPERPPLPDAVTIVEQDKLFTFVREKKR